MQSRWSGLSARLAIGITFTISMVTPVPWYARLSNWDLSFSAGATSPSKLNTHELVASSYHQIEPRSLRLAQVRETLRIHGVFGSSPSTSTSDKCASPSTILIAPNSICPGTGLYAAFWPHNFARCGLPTSGEHQRCCPAGRTSFRPVMSSGHWNPCSGCESQRELSAGS